MYRCRPADLNILVPYSRYLSPIDVSDYTPTFFLQYCLCKGLYIYIQAVVKESQMEQEKRKKKKSFSSFYDYQHHYIAIDRNVWYVKACDVSPPPPLKLMARVISISRNPEKITARSHLPGQ